jgi:hypothetical protein
MAPLPAILAERDAGIRPGFVDEARLAVDEDVFADKRTRTGSSGGVPDVEVDLSAGAPGGLLDDAGPASGPEEFMIRRPLESFRNVIWGGLDRFCAVTEDRDIADLKITGGLREPDPEFLLHVGEGG